MKGPRRFTKDNLRGRVAFYIGDHHQLATDAARGQWYWSADGWQYEGPYRCRRDAQRAYEAALGIRGGRAGSRGGPSDG